MTPFKWILALSLTLLAGGCMINSELVATTDTMKNPNAARYEDGKFHNRAETNQAGFGKTVGIFWRFMTASKVDAEPEVSLPVKTITREQLGNLADDRFWLVKLGHSSVLLKVYGDYWLIDPVFAERASPFSFMGPKRFHQPPIELKELPPIKKVLISHNHYDHLDKDAIAYLAELSERFYAPLGVDGDLKKWGVAEEKIRIFDWWQEERVDDQLIAFAPTQHFSGRGMTDRNSTLWGSWVIKTANESLYFSGDSGYFADFKQIGETYGPFDLTMIENGAYNEDWADIHMTPEESVQAHLDLQGKVMMPIHNGTFDLAFHAWYDPLNRVTEAAEANQVSLSTPVVGDILQVTSPAVEKRWWQSLQKTQLATL